MEREREKKEEGKKTVVWGKTTSLHLYFSFFYYFFLIFIFLTFLHYEFELNLKFTP